MESGVSQLTFCKAEPKDHQALLKTVSTVLIQGGSLHAEQFTFEKWHWKYFQLKNAAPQIFICKEADKILGYYHCPVYNGKIGGADKKFAMIQDVGVSEEARGKGVFRKLANYATQQLIQSGVDVLYTFPNEKSIHTFLKYNSYSKVETLSTFVLPISFKSILQKRIKTMHLGKLLGGFLDALYRLKATKSTSDYSVVHLPKLEEDFVSLFKEFDTGFVFALERNMDYLHWRYEQKPGAKHWFFAVQKNETKEAAVVVSIEDLMGTRSLVVLDFAAKNTEAFVQLIHELRAKSENYFGEKLGLIYTSLSSNQDAYFKQAGFLKIPQRFNPRAIHLLAQAVSPSDKDIAQAKNWRITLSDWDVL